MKKNITEEELEAHIAKNKSKYLIGFNELVFKTIDMRRINKVVSMNLYETKSYPVHPFYKDISRLL